jgi:hypothetical protein
MSELCVGEACLVTSFLDGNDQIQGSGFFLSSGKYSYLVHVWAPYLFSILWRRRKYSAKAEDETGASFWATYSAFDKVA